jgi:hypothetical protein
MNILNKPKKGKNELKLIKSCVENLDQYCEYKNLLKTNIIDALLKVKHEFYSKNEVVF